jgi:hypothetical protein
MRVLRLWDSPTALGETLRTLVDILSAEDEEVVSPKTGNEWLGVFIIT